jgi:hypothetical protein
VRSLGLRRHAPVSPKSAPPAPRAARAPAKDETMHMLYSRYGKQRLEAEMKALFGSSLST